ncbi:MAG TPA: ECF transporter S component [Mobilitalea sp.]|nr:ECF transporter S component [Mobilitalea sp.]
MKTDQLRKYVTAALMAAMTCVATFILHIPTPGGGYIHPGDAFVLLSGIILGPLYGSLAAGTGSLLADLLAGYAVYAPATFILKALAAVVAALIFRRGKMGTVILAGFLGGAIITSGYFIYEFFLYGFAGALKQIPPNGIQNVSGIILSVLLFPLLRKIPQIKEIMDDRV